MGCLLFIVGAVVWYLILKYIGFSPHSGELCGYLDCNFPADYDINWFGKIWFFSPLWLPWVIVIFLNLKSRLTDMARADFVEILMRYKKQLLFVTCVGLFVLAFHFLGIDYLVKKFEMYSEAEELYSQKDYIHAIEGFGNLPGFKDSDEKVNEIFNSMTKEIDDFLVNGNTVRVQEYIGVLKYDLSLSDEQNSILKEQERELERLQDIQLAEEREKLKYIEPYEGMHESDIEYSSWGPPTEINKDVNYESLRADRRVEHYKWIKKDEYGRIIEIKSLMVKQGFVWGEPRISHYWVNN